MKPAVTLLEDKVAIVTGGAVVDWFIRIPVSQCRCNPTRTAGPPGHRYSRPYQLTTAWRSSSPTSTRRRALC